MKLKLQNPLQYLETRNLVQATEFLAKDLFEKHIFLGGGVKEHGNIRTLLDSRAIEVRNLYDVNQVVFMGETMHFYIGAFILVMET